MDASKRMVTPIFFGRNRSMVVVFNFRAKESGIWREVPEEVLCSYETHHDLDKEIDDSDKLLHQLLFGEQVALCDALKNSFEWQMVERLGIAALLRLDFLLKLRDNCSEIGPPKRCG
ncbi:hypothetical protein DICVIV_02937 [Dictyocaulus viviparus]|uniref:Uncharacterized protein n=1 Tax=Dictyocaulus viviparus TaxID=29172 RepID=A0A0D8Y1Z9_DICVI|nr:hypothetical protein DICVIV_02937 [Dictyocaulus viviparus]